MNLSLITTWIGVGKTTTITTIRLWIEEFTFMERGEAALEGSGQIEARKNSILVTGIQVQYMVL